MARHQRGPVLARYRPCPHPPDPATRLRGLQDLVALAVPAIVLTTKRAWSMTEAAYARGFESPHRRSFHRLRFRRRDWLLMLGRC